MTPIPYIFTNYEHILVPLNKNINRMMSLSPQVDLSGDRDCHCLGYDSQQQQYFLSHKSL